jgi:hypothetical protein
VKVFAVASDFTNQASCGSPTNADTQAYYWDTVTLGCYTDEAAATAALNSTDTTATGGSFTMRLQNEQTISVITLIKKTNEADITAGSTYYYVSDLSADEIPAVWGVVTNGRFSMSIENDFSSIMDDKNTVDTTDDVAMFSDPGGIKDDTGVTIAWPAFVKWETHANGKQYNGVDITGDKRYEVLPAKFEINILNTDSHSGTITNTSGTSSSDNFNSIKWIGSGEEVIGSGVTNNKFPDLVGNLQVSDTLGASGDLSTAGIITYSWTDTDNSPQKAVVPDHIVPIFVHQEMDSSIANSVQAGTYYTAIKLTVVALEGT